MDSGAHLRTGVTFTTIEARDDGVQVTFTDGQVRDYDLLVGADDFYSQVRETAFGAERKPRYTGQVCWRYNLPRIVGLDKIWVFIGATGTAGFVPLASDLMYMLTIEKPPEGAPVRVEREGIAAVYRERLAQFGGPVADQRELIVDDDAVVYRPVENVLVRSRPSTRRRYERCKVIVEGPEAIGRWEQDHSLPLDPTQVRQEVMMAAMAPL
ncbi:MAG: hypothetical protein ACRDPM_00145 [Solirubrobacteraceae bacterium]